MPTEFSSALEQLVSVHTSALEQLISAHTSEVQQLQELIVDLSVHPKKRSTKESIVQKSPKKLSIKESTVQNNPMKDTQTRLLHASSSRCFLKFVGSPVGILNEHDNSFAAPGIEPQSPVPVIGPQSPVPSDSEDSVLSIEIAERWQILAYGVLTARHCTEYVVHPGWSEAQRETSLVKSNTIATQKATLAAQEKKAARLSMRSVNGSRNLLDRAKIYAKSREFNFTCSKPDSFMLHPASYTRRFWIALCFVVLLYELFSVTMSPFGVVDDSEGTTLEWCAAYFWALDIVVTFMSGIYLEGTIEMRFIVIAKRYCQTWLSFDFLVVAFQFMRLLIPTLSETVLTIVFLRIIRLVRFFRVGRVVHCLGDDLGLSRATMSRGKLVQVIVALYFFAHCFACLLYEVGKSDGGWISRYRDRLQDEAVENSAAHNYLVCLHWTLSQLQGNVDMYPGVSTTGNLLFVVISSCCSIVALTLFVSSATDTFSDVRQQAQLQLEEERLMHEFFARHAINSEVKHRAEHYLYLKNKLQKSVDGHDRDHKALMKFPKQLRSCLLTEMWGSWIGSHPIFAYLNKSNRNNFVKVCANVLFVQKYEPKDDVFTVGESSSCAHVILNGEFMLSTTVDRMLTNLAGPGVSWMQSGDPEKSFETVKSHKSHATVRSHATLQSPRFGLNSQSQTPWKFGSTSPTKSSPKTSPSTLRSSGSSHVQAMDAFLNQTRPVRKVHSGRLISEISLWMPWVYEGDLCSTDHGQCLEIRTLDLISTVKKHATAYVVFATYAQRFVRAAEHARDNRNSCIELMSFRAVLEFEAHFNAQQYMSA